MMTARYPCGCVNVRHAPTGAFRCLSKCAHHRAMQMSPVMLDEAYYTKLGVLKDGKLAETNHVAELREALGEWPSPKNYRATASNPYPVAIELGCGASPYVGSLIGAGFWYLGIDQSRWAVDWVETIDPRSKTVARDVDEFLIATEAKSSVPLILAAHVFEHLPDAPSSIRKAAQALMPGGEFWIVVPDDSDPVNPDHLWFFNEASLRRTVELAGLTVLRLETRRYIARENFLYLRAIKPQ